MLLIVSFRAHGPEHNPDPVPLDRHKCHVQNVEIYNQPLGEVVEVRLFSSQVQDKTEN